MRSSLFSLVVLKNYANGKRKRTVAINTNLNSTVRDNVANVFGAKKVQDLFDFDIELEKDGNITAQRLDVAHESAASIKGLISKASIETSHASDRQMFYVNSRPCNLPQVSKSFNEIYKNFNLHSSPFIFANLLISSDRYEVRPLPGKTTVHLHDEQELLETLKTSLSLLLKAQPFSFPQNSRPPQVSSLKHHQSREDYAFKPLEEAKYHRKEYQVGSPNIQNSGKNFEETLSPVSSEGFTSIGEDVVSDENSEGPALPSTIKGRDQESKNNLAKGAFRPESHDTNVVRVHQGLERDPNYRDPKRPRLETSITEKSTLATKSTMLRHKSAVSAMPSANDIDSELNHNEPPETGGFRVKLPASNHEKYNMTKVGANETASQYDKSWNSLPWEIIHIKSKAAEHNPGFTFARNHHDIIKLQNQGQLGSEESLESRNTLIDDDEPEKKAQLFNEGPVMKQSTDGEEPGLADGEESLVDERKNKAYQNSKVSSLIAKAEEANVISSKNLKIRAISTLTSVHKSGVMMQPVRNLTFKPLSGAIESTCFTDMSRTGKSAVRNDMEDLEDKVNTLSLSKSEFANMYVIGQFNFGFVLAATTLRAAKASSTSPDLFIFDQHASDEKYNFETFENTLPISSQQLAHPQSIELTAVEEELVSRYDNVLLRNGFKLSHEQAEPVRSGVRRRLIGLPSLGGVLYNKSDFQDLLNILSENYEDKIEHKLSMPRPAKTRKILAMKACRSSIMIGKSLSKSQMKQIILQMGQIDKPWHCPHGRPTIKYLYSLNRFVQWREGDGVVGIAADSKRSKRTDWAAYVR